MLPAKERKLENSDSGKDCFESSLFVFLSKRHIFTTLYHNVKLKLCSYDFGVLVSRSKITDMIINMAG